MASNENIPRQYQTGLVNIVGVNNAASAPRPQATGLQMPQPQGLPLQDVKPPEYPQLPDVTDQKFQQLKQDSEARYQTVLEGMKAQANIRQMAIESRGMPGRMAGLASIFDSVAGAGLKYLEYEKEKQANKADVEKQRNAMMARAALEELTIDARSRIRQYGDEQGIYTTREDARRILEEYAKVLPPEEMVPLYQFYGTEMRELESSASTRYFEAAQEQKNAQINLVKSTLNYQVSSIVGALTNPSINQQQSDYLFSQVYDTLIQGTEGLDPTSRLEILGDVLGPIAGVATTTAGQRNAIEQRLTDLQWFLPYVENELRPQYGDDPTQFRYALWMSAPESLKDLVGDIPNNTQITQQLAQQLGAENEIQQHYRERYRQQSFAEGVQPQAVKVGLELAYRMMSGDSNALAQLSLLQNKDKEELMPHEVMALQYYETWNTSRTKLEELRQQLNAQNVTLASRVMQFPANTIQTTTWVDPSTGTAYQLPVLDQNQQPTFVNQNLPQEQREAAIAAVEATNAERLRIQNEIQTLIQQSAASGFDVTNPNNRSYLDLIYNELDQQAAGQAFGTSQQPNDPSGNPNFGFSQQPNGPVPNSPNAVRQQARDLSGFNWGADEPPPGYPSGQTPVAPLASLNGMVIPFSHNRTDIQVSSEYGERWSPTRGGYRHHAGVDFASSSMYDSDVGAVTPAGGHVVAVFDWNDYGGTVMVQTPEGYVEQYSHLRNFFVKEGDQIRPGQAVGVVGGGEGDPMAGGSTGRHLHFQVWKPGISQYTDPINDTLEPMTYLSNLQQFEEIPRGSGPVPEQPVGTTITTPSPNSVPDGRGNWYGNINAQRFPYLTRFLQQGGGMNAIQSVPVEQFYQNNAPQPQSSLSDNKSAYPGQNNPNHNYGYQTIAHDTQFARALAEVSDEIGIPAVWLADLLFVESGFRTDAVGPSTWLGNGIGMIQTMSGGVLAEWGISPGEVQNMSRAQQTREIVRRYLLPWKGRINSVTDLVNVVRQGTLTPSGSSSDGWTTRDTYIDRMGAAVGRRYGQGGDYRQELGQTHESFQQGCAICAQQLSRFNAIIPHEP